jgi:predicted nucleic acid-binding protein
VPIVIDVNVAVDWFSSQSTKLADAALDVVGREGAIVPALWRWEVQDVLRRLARDERLNMTAAEALAALRALPIEIDSELLGLFGQGFVLASDHGLSVYDASYLELALRRNVKLATGAKQLAAAARTMGLAFSGG